MMINRRNLTNETIIINLKILPDKINISALVNHLNCHCKFLLISNKLQIIVKCQLKISISC